MMSVSSGHPTRMPWHQVSLMVSLISDFVDMMLVSSGHPTRMPWHRCFIDGVIGEPFLRCCSLVSQLLSPCFPFVLSMLRERLWDCILTSIDNFYVNQWLQTGDFLIPFLHLYLLIGILLQGINLCFCLFFIVSMDSHSISYCLLGHFLFWCSNWPRLGYCEFIKVVLSPCDTHPSFLSTFYFGACEDVPGLSGVFLAPAIELAISLCFLLGRSIFRNQDLGSRWSGWISNFL